MNNLIQKSSTITADTIHEPVLYSFESSFSQQRLWLIDQLLENKSVYNIPAAIRLRGPLHIEDMEKAFLNIIHRHDTLRTTFREQDGEIEQIVSETIPWNLSIADFTHYSENVRWKIAYEMAEEEARTPFHLEEGPLIRNQLIKLGEEDHLLLITLHHIISDGWSSNILIRELSQYYNAFSCGEEIEVEELPIQYADYAHFQKEWLQGESLESQLMYWKEKLSGELPVLQLSSAGPRPEAPRNTGHTLEFTVNNKVSELVTEVSRREGMTPFMILLAVYKIWLYRYSNQTDLLVGTPVAGRDLEEVEDLIGFFANNLVIRTEINEKISFRSFLQQLKQTVVEAYSHQEVPFEKVVEAVQPERDIKVTSIFQNMFAFRKQEKALTLNGLQTEFIQVERGTSKFDLLMELTETEECFTGLLEYSTELFEEATINQMIEHFLQLLDGALTHPEESIARLSMLTDKEVKQQLIEWNETKKDSPKSGVQELFENWASTAPERTALIYGEQTVSYGDLNRQANQLAHRLQSLGVGPDMLVGICLERSPELVAGVLAVLKAGGAYVPLDPALPKERLESMMEQIGLKALVTKQILIEGVNETDLAILCLDKESHCLEEEREDNPESSADENNLMYVIYTSGSTGMPKGASVYRRGFANLVQWYTQEFEMTDQDHVLMITSPSFDLTQKNIFAPLMTGGQLVLLPTGPYDAAEVVELISQYDITLLNGTPSMFYPLLDETSSSSYRALRTLRYVFLGGEPIAPDRLLDWTTSQLCQAEVVNTYGPTECTDVTVYTRLRDMQSFVGKPVPIGRPVPNTRLYILNEGLGLVPTGIPGELCIAGVQVGGGYIGDEDKTAEKFVSNPYGDESAPVLYRTGDVARYRQDGTIEYLGRMDHQVKIRGYRIELGEIEAALRECSNVKDVVVTAREDRPGGKRLIAYIVMTEKLEEDHIAVWREELLRKLPEYMVPYTFMILEKLPFSPNGKVDRKALPAPEKTSVVEEGLHTAPRNELEQTIATIWAEVLQVEKIGIYDNFFELGGHSLLATKVATRLRSSLHVALPLRVLFEQPTIAGLSAEIATACQKDHVEEAGEMQLDEGNEPIPHVSREDGVPLSFTQQRLWFLDRMDSGSAYNIYSAVRMSGRLDKKILESCLNQLAERHEALRTTFHEGNNLVQRIASSITLQLPVVDLRHMDSERQKAEVERLAVEEAERPFNLESDPLLRVTLLWLDETEYVLLITMHHIISDGWSIDVLVRELGEFYSAKCKGIPAVLPDLTIQYPDYAVWQNNKLTGETFERLTTYWTKQLGGELPILELPTDYLRPKRQSFRGSRTKLHVPIEVSKRLKELCHQEGVTLFMVMLSAFSVLLHRLSRQEDLIIGTPIAGRTRMETERLIGCFVNTLALRIDLADNPIFTNLLAHVRTVCLDAYAHQDMPFEKLVEILQPERSLSRNPIFDVMINLVNTPNHSESLQGITTSPLEISEPQSKFSLTLYIHENTNGMDLEFVYQKDLYSRKRMEEFARQYAFLLKQIVENSKLGILTYSLITSEGLKLLPDPRKELEKKDYPTVPERFAATAVRYPDAEAVIHRGEKRTYRELAESVNNITTQLMKSDFERGEVVAIMGPRCFGVIASILGVMSAGGIILTIDQNMPAERKQAVLDASGAKHLLYSSYDQNVDEASWNEDDFKQIQVINPMTGQLVTTVDTSMNRNESERLFPLPDDPAYIFFTSGTTGTPKGVLGQHRGLSHFLTWQLEQFDIGIGDRGAQLTGLSFDVVLRDILLPLTSGATICLPDNEMDLSAVSVLPWMEKERITYFHTVPALAQSWLSGGSTNVTLSSLRYIFFAGEPLPAGLIKSWRTTFSETTEIVNLYGPTETTLAKCFYIVPKPENLPSIQPVGQPLPETQVLVVNGDRQLCGIGEPGEIVIRTPYRSLGYLGQKEKETARFVNNPFGDDSEDIVYFTGDLGIYRPDGLLDIAGRLDDQIKIRGMRVKLGEIQAVISSHPLVKEVVVMAYPAPNGEKRLVTYYVVKVDSVDVAEIRAYAKEKLVEYMIPRAFIQLDNIPLSPNGKVNRRKLPDPSTALQESNTVSYVAPTTNSEQEIETIWRELLGLEKVGIHDNFFDLGGHSLLLLQAKTKLTEVLGRDVPIVELFQYPTISSLASYLNNGGDQAEVFKVSQERANIRQDALRQRRQMRKKNKKRSSD